MSKIILLEKIHPNASRIFHESGCTEVEEIAGALSGSALIAALAQAEMVGIRSRTQITAEVMDALPSLRAIGCFCIGTNQVDLEAAAERGVVVFNAPYSNTRSVAELVIGQAILLLRGIPEKNAQAHRGEWNKSADGAHEVRGRTLGIIGYGNIGAQVGILAESVGMRVVYFDVARKLPLGNARPLDRLEHLMAEADVLTLHVPGGPSTLRMIDAQRLACMKPSAVLINASRGGVVDIDALRAALQHKMLAGAALDVFPVEPGSDKEEFVCTLRGLDNVILTPHIGGSTEEAQENIGTEVADKLLRFLTHGTTWSAVNFPQLAQTPQSTRTRIIHIHRNEPGVIARLNALLAANRLNIAAQQLQTRGDIGCALIDIDSSVDDAMLGLLRGDQAAIRCDLLR